MTHTENYNLNLPDDDDFFDIGHMNENMETLDAQMHDVEVQTESMADKIGLPTDSGTSTLFGKINKLTEEIKKCSAVYTPNGSKTFALATPSTAPKFTMQTGTQNEYVLIGVPFKCKFSGYMYVDIDLYLTVDTTASSPSLRVFMLSSTGAQQYTADSPMAVTHYKEFANLPNGTAIIYGTSATAEPKLYDKTELLAEWSQNNIASKGVKTHLTGFKYIKVSKGDTIRMVLNTFYPPCTVENINIKLKYDEYEGE